MPYVERITRAGKTIEVERYFTSRYKKPGIKRGDKRWNCSKNLVRPEPEIRVITDRQWFKAEPREIKGYYVDKDSVSKGVHSPDYYGYGYFRYTLVKLEEKGG